MALKRVCTHGSGTENQRSISSLTLQEVMDLGRLVHYFSAHRLVAGLGILDDVAKEIDHVLVDGH